MSFMNYVRLLLAVTLTWQMFPALGWASSPQDLIEQMLPPETVLPHAEAIGLTAEQRATLQREIATLQASMGPLQRRMREETGVLVRMLAQAKPDDAAVLAQYEKLNATENEVKRLRVTMTLRVKAMLTSEQQEKVRTLRAEPVGNSGEAAGNRSGVAGKLQRVKQGLERWKREGRDVTKVRALWEQFQQAAEARQHGEAQRLLNEALAILDAPAAPLATTPAPRP